VSAQEALEQTYGRLLATLAAAPEEAGWQATRLPGWTVRDLVHHLTADANRALVALHTPADGAATADAVTYWAEFSPGEPSAEANLRGTRIMASAWTRFQALGDLYAETARAVLVAARERGHDDVVLTQGKRIRVADVLSTLVVEATVHHLDLRLGEPSGRGLAEVRQVLNGLLGAPAPFADDARYALVGTGREPLSADEATQLGPLAARFPVFG